MEELAANPQNVIKLGNQLKTVSSDLKIPAIQDPWYTGITFLPGDRVMLADHDNKQCIVLSSSYQFITSYTLTVQPWNICVLNEKEVAVSFFGLNEIQILSVIVDVINSVSTIRTNCICDGITDAGKGQMIINDGAKGCWSLISSTGEVKASHQYDSDKSHYNYILSE
ncbi:hypothetical protein CHS0354_026572 [Potamilus streckersoni]|uniref:Uncharacterized protein n=1 Tax=Potamilus streckersoni TaxID=2493646 RepID=A0AAE0TIS5_9BIVA|nr:hypothetical protein CHS0354_026572 [Potamilus streckersoni]